MSGESLRLAVSVIQFTSREHLILCLEALVRQSGVTMDVIVPHDDSLADVDGLAARFPAVRFIGLPGRRTPAQLRASAARATDAEVLAFLEDHCVPAADWAWRLLAAHAAPHAAVGGAVEKGFPPGRSTDTPLNWAVYLTDYSRYMNPQPGRAAHSLTDCNVSYKRSALESIRSSWEEEFHENVVNGLLLERGETLWLAPEVVVYEQRTLSLRTALRDRYSFGRLFASTRVVDAPLARRMVYAAGSLAMPPVLILRVARNLFGRRRHRAQLVRSLPSLALVTSVWMLGESVGYVMGRPDASLSSIEPAPGPGNGIAVPGRAGR